MVLKTILIRKDNCKTEHIKNKSEPVKNQGYGRIVKSLSNPYKKFCY